MNFCREREIEEILDGVSSMNGKVTYTSGNELLDSGQVGFSEELDGARVLTKRGKVLQKLPQVVSHSPSILTSNTLSDWPANWTKVS